MDTRIDDTPWEAFRRRHLGDRRLALDPLYALDDRLISSLAAVPRPLLKAGDVLFERDLTATTAGGGFFRGRPFAGPFFRAPRPAPQDDDPVGAAANAAVGEALELLMGPRGREEFERQQEASDTETDLRLRAYAMWILLQQTFRAEVAALRGRSGGLIDETGAFPRLPRSYLGERPSPSRDDRTRDFLLFYRRWSLDTFVTWDLPCPVRPQLLGAVTLETFSASEAGVVLFVPWSMLRDQHLDLHALAERLRDLKRPGHLRGWCDPMSVSGVVAPGYDRLNYQFAIYRYLHLALRPRYATALRGKTERVDAALAGPLTDLLEVTVGVETVRKMRQAFDRELG